MKLKYTSEIKNEKIIVPIYYAETDEGDIIVDEDSMQNEFEQKLNEVLKNPKKFLNLK